MLWEDNYLAHYGITGQKWGIRRYQNKDGTLTEAGKKRYGETKDDTKKKLDEAKSSAEKAKRIYLNKSSRLIFTTDIAIHRAKKKWSKAEKLVKQIQGVYDKRPDDNKVQKQAEYKNGWKKGEEDIKTLKAITNNNDKKEKELDLLDKYIDYNDREHYAIYGTSSDGDGTDTRPYRVKYEEFKQKNANEDGWHEAVGSYFYTEVGDKTMDGYNGIPISNRIKALYNYIPDPDGARSSYDTYENWRPKYESTKEYKDTEKRIDQAKIASGLNDAQDRWYGRGAYKNEDQKKITMRELDRREKVLRKAEKAFKEMTKDDFAKQDKMWEEHKEKIIKAALQDMGWPVTEKYIKAIEPMIWWD